MTKHQAFAIDLVLSCLATWGSVILLNSFGVDERLQAVAGILGIVGGAAMVGVITVHYVHKREAEEAERDRD
jgi:Cu/Ag efflux pump CusA